MLPTVCVIIPTYNQAAFIAKAVTSALQQDYPNMQVVVADDHSSDDTRGVLDPFVRSGRVQYFSSEANMGRVANYRHALTKYTAAEWVVNLDGDDHFTNPGFISAAMRAVQAAGCEDVLFFQGTNLLRCQGERDEPGFTETEKSRTITAREYFFQYFRRSNFSHMATLYNRSAALASRFYEVDVLSTDVYSFLRLCLGNLDKKVIVSNLVAGVWLQHDANTSKSIDLAVHLRNYRLLSSLGRLAVQRHLSTAACLLWQLRLSLFYLLLYAGLLVRAGHRRLKA